MNNKKKRGARSHRNIQLRSVIHTSQLNSILISRFQMNSLTLTKMNQKKMAHREQIEKKALLLYKTQLFVFEFKIEEKETTFSAIFKYSKPP